MVDSEGMELPDRASMRKQVARILADVARDELPTEDRAVISIKVRNSEGVVIALTSLTFDTEWLG
jgi:hypothetical protein